MNIYKIGIYTFFSIIISSLVGFIAMIGAYSLPIKAIRSNSLQSAQIIMKEREVFYNISKNITGSGIDNFSTSIMLNTASFNQRKSIINNALLNSRIQYNNSNKPYDLYKSLTNTTINSEDIIDYPRYWHGYLTVLKPLLMFFNLKEIRIINFIFQTILLLITLYLLSKRLNTKYAIAFLTSIIYLNPISLGLCLQYSSTYYIMLLSTICILLPIIKSNYWKIFLFTGIATSFFEFLTSPLITLGFPLIVYINLYHKNFKQDLINIIKNSILWFLGYASMWFSKWGITTIITKKNIILDGINTTLYRINGDGYLETGIQNYTSLHAIQNNLHEFYNITNLIIILIFLILICASYFTNRYNFQKNYTTILTLLIGLYPFVWYSIIINHSIIHPILTHRNLTITILALTMGLVSTIKTQKTGEEK